MECNTYTSALHELWIAHTQWYCHFSGQKQKKQSLILSQSLFSVYFAKKCSNINAHVLFINIVCFCTQVNAKEEKLLKAWLWRIHTCQWRCFWNFPLNFSLNLGVLNYLVLFLLWTQCIRTSTLFILTTIFLTFPPLISLPASNLPPLSLSLSPSSARDRISNWVLNRSGKPNYSVFLYLNLVQCIAKAVCHSFQFLQFFSDFPCIILLYQWFFVNW